MRLIPRSSGGHSEKKTKNLFFAARKFNHFFKQKKGKSRKTASHCLLGPTEEASLPMKSSPEIRLFQAGNY